MCKCMKEKYAEKHNSQPRRTALQAKKEIRFITSNDAVKEMDLSTDNDDEARLYCSDFFSHCKPKLIKMF